MQAGYHITSAIRAESKKKTKLTVMQQDHQALLKAKYCPRVAAASCTQKIHPCDLDL